MIFMQGKGGGHISLCMHIRELYGSGGGGGSGEFEHASLICT